MLLLFLKNIGTMKAFLRTIASPAGFLLLAATLLWFSTANAAPRKKWYDASLDGNKQLDEAIVKAKAAGKYVLVQVGGDWCKWCIRLNQTIEQDAELLKLMNDKYEWVHLFYGKENKNEAVMERLKNPNKLGFPVFVLLDSKGNYLNTFATDVLEKGDGYDRAKLVTFLRDAPQCKE